jgi:hypothetical protein
MKIVHVRGCTWAQQRKEHRSLRQGDVKIVIIIMTLWLSAAGEHGLPAQAVLGRGTGQALGSGGPHFERCARVCTQSIVSRFLSLQPDPGT